MKQQLKQNRGRFILLNLIFSGLMLQAQTERNEVTNRIYNIISENSIHFPEPVFLDTINMGTYDHTTGTFDGKVGYYIQIQEGRRTVRRRVNPVEQSEAANTILIFRSLHDGVRLKVTIDNKDYTGAGKILVVPIRTSSYIRWKVSIVSQPRATVRSYQDVLQIVRKKFYGAGAYTLPYIPISIVYAPPITGNSDNRISYTETSIIGTTLKLTSGTEVSESRPELQPINYLYKGLDFAISRTAASSDPYTMAAHNAMKHIRDAFGNMNVTVTSGTVTENGLEMTSIYQNSVTRSNPIPTAGPAHSDQFIILKNVRVMWLVDANKFSYSILDFEKQLYLTLDDIRASADVNLQALISLDQFALVGPKTPRYSRLSFGGTIGRNLPLKCSISETDIIKNSNAITSYTSRLTEYTSGTLGFLGIGYEDKTIKQVFSKGFSESSITSLQKISEIDIINKTNGIADFEVYYDNLFGTIAVHLVPKYRVADRNNSTKTQ